MTAAAEPNMVQSHQIWFGLDHEEQITMPLRVLDQILGTQTKVQLLRTLSRMGSPMSGREAQRLAGVKSVSGAGRALDELTELGILHREETGGAHLYRMNREHVLAGPLVRLIEAEEDVLASLRDILTESLESARVAGAVRSVVVFGSAARGEARPESDLDLLVIVRDDESTEPVRRALLDVQPRLRQRLGLRASPYVLTQERAEERHLDGDPLMETIQAEGRTLLGDSLQEVVGAW